MNFPISIQPSFYFLLALLLLALPVNWLFSAVFAAFFHEACHILAIHMLGGRIWSIQVGAGGAVIEAETLSWGRELLCAMAGPLGSLLLLLFIRKIPRIALCAGFHAAFNLFPLFPLDGGRILKCTAQLILPEKYAQPVCTFLESGVLLALLVLSVIAGFYLSFGWIPLILSVILLVKGLSRKLSCKDGQLRVQ